MERFTCTRRELISLMLMVLTISFLLTPIHVLSHGAWISRCLGPDAILSAQPAYPDPGSSAFGCSVCRSFNLSLFHNSPLSSVVRLPSAVGFSEETLTIIKSIDPLDWQSNRAPPLV
jgi:hypothetical protein